MGVAPRLSSALRLLIADQDAAARRILRAALESRIARPLMILETAEPDAAAAMLAESAIDAAAIDLRTIGGAERLRSMIARSGNAVIYAMGRPDDVKEAVAAVQAGAADFIEKPIDGAAFARRIERQFTGAEALSTEGFEGLTGASPAMKAVFEQLARIAPTAAPVLVTGESGTGKSLAAHALHLRSRRRSGPFVTLDCAAAPDAALAADLGGAAGALVRADGGTLHLHEVGALGPAAQVVLSRYLDSGEVAGDDAVLRPSVRLVASSCRSAAALGGPGGLRPECFFRLAVLTVALPALRERADDIPVLAEALIRQVGRETGSRPLRLTSAAYRALLDHDWPGNVRELRNVAERLAAAHAGGSVDADDLLREIGTVGHPAAPSAPDAPRVRPLWMEEERLIEEAIAAFDGNIAKAAAALEISPSTIYRKRKPGSAQPMVA